MPLRRLTVLVGGLVFVASIAAAQLPQLRGGNRPGRLTNALRWARPEDFDGAFVFCRLYYDSHPWGSGGSWGVDYPRADVNFPFRLSELTTTSVSRDSTGEYNHVLVTGADPLLFHCPFVMMTEPGRADFSPAEIAGLRNYLLKGGFLWVDDFWGTNEWNNFEEQMSAVLPPGQYPIKDLPLSHPVFSSLYDIKHLTQIPNIGFWTSTGGATSEHGYDSAEPHVRGISDDRGRLMVIITFNTDFGDAFEREGDNHQYFLAFAPDGYAFGVNTLLYAFSH